MVQVIDLPAELLDLIASDIPSIGDLKNLRLTARAFDRAAAKQLFQLAVLRPGSVAEQQWREFAEVSTVSHFVRGLELHAFPDLNWISCIWGDRDFSGWTLTYEHQQCVQLSRRCFKNACAIDFKFSADVCNQKGLYKTSPLPSPDHAQRPSGRSVSLIGLFGCMAARARSDELATISNLTLTQISNFPHKWLAGHSEQVQLGLAGIAGLHMFVRGEKSAQSPGLEIYDPCIIAWPQHLQQAWIEPTAANLTSLSLYHDYHWGVVPYHDLSGIVLPKLKSLCLGNFTIAYRCQVDWILSLASLERLSFDDSPIVVFMSVQPRQETNFRVGVDGRCLTQISPSMFINGCYIGVLRWGELMEEIGSCLRNLKSFTMGHGEKWRTRGDRHAFEDRYHLENRLCTTRYIAFNGWNASALPWITPREDGESSEVLQRCDDEFEHLGRNDFISMCAANSLPKLDRTVLERDAEGLARIQSIIASRARR